MPESFDVIIVGGRPAGASLAARLGARGLRVLVLERLDIDTQPAVPSCPTLHMGTLRLLDELGVPEGLYAPEAMRFETIVIQFGAWFTARMPLPDVHGRSHGLSIDRSRFDRALWDHLAAFPTVTRRRFSVTALVRDDLGRVIGIDGNTIGAEPGGLPERILAAWVVCADGRFSAVARLAGAATVEEETRYSSTVYFTDWEGVAPREGGGAPEVQIVATGRGMNVLLFPLPGGRTTVCVHMRSDRVDVGGDPAGWYERTLRSVPQIVARLDAARPVVKVVGLKKVGNGCRKAGGPGWLLAGDARHYKDPVDGQGIYDALLGTSILAEELLRHFDGRVEPEARVGAAMVEAYEERAIAATRPMYLATVKRLETELYSEPPVAVIRTLLRWFLTDREYQLRFLRFLVRDLDPATWMAPRMLVGAIFRGLRRDLFGWVPEPMAERAPDT